VHLFLKAVAVGIFDREIFVPEYQQLLRMYFSSAPKLRQFFYFWQ